MRDNWKYEKPMGRLKAGLCVGIGVLTAEAAVRGQIGIFFK